MATNFKFNNGGTVTDFSDVFIPRDLFSSGGLWAWGWNGYAQLGDNTVVDKSSPVQTVATGTNWKQVSSSRQNSAGIKTDGTLWNWGTGTSGQLGDNTLISKSSPVQTISTGTNWKQVASCQWATAAIKTDGTLWTWGANTSGNIGDNGTSSRSSPVQTIATGSNWKQVAAGRFSFYAVKTDGTLWAWGSNAYGQLGDNSIINKSSPVQTISTGTNWKQVAGGYTHAAAIKTDGTLWNWGRNNYGQLGANLSTASTAAVSSPIQTISGGTNWKQVASGNGINFGIKTDGTLWGWGQGQYNGLGDSGSANRSSPVQTIATGTNWKQVASGGRHSGAIKTDGTLWLWGQNGNGQLGTGTVVAAASPVQTLMPGTNWKAVFIGSSSSSTFAITDIF